MFYYFVPNLKNEINQKPKNFLGIWSSKQATFINLIAPPIKERIAFTFYSTTLPSYLLVFAFYSTYLPSYLLCTSCFHLF